MQSVRATAGWIGFVLLFGLSLRALIQDESLTMEVWTYLLLMPIALTFAFSTRIFSNVGIHEKSEIVDEETEDVDSKNQVEAPDPEDAGFDIPVM